MKPQLERMLEMQQYYVAGDHSAVKLCHWLKEKLTSGRSCYKEKFYGIDCHRCLQMTPAVNQCNQKCLFCWRFQGLNELHFKKYDEPEFILDTLIEGQRKLLTGFKGNPKCSLEMYEEARNPNQVAISLSGEPTLYPELGSFIELCHKRGMTTFLVTNGTLPEALEELDPLPTQLYVSLDAPNEEIYKRLCVPMAKSASWDSVMETLNILPSLDTRTVIRHTLVKGYNLGYEKEYAALIDVADPDFVEPKGYVFVGYSRNRMTIDNMPSHNEIREFSQELADRTGLRILGEQRASRVVVMGKDRKKLRIR
ncbi:MAG: 4-demethylwyosine synthase TYW1 [Candidatus Thermoplasmatota archaeon]|jgi:tRNA wybutosine-synthesizing protein 1|nr:4-demethylwyosine synthase TYW1 [Candidatus Thermoplasmatota archaeon]